MRGATELAVCKTCDDGKGAKHPLPEKQGVAECKCRPPIVADRGQVGLVSNLESLLQKFMNATSNSEHPVFAKEEKDIAPT